MHNGGVSTNVITLCEKPNYSVMQMQCCCPGYKTGFGANISRKELVIPAVDLDLFGGGSQSVVVIYHSTFERVGGGVRGTTKVSFYLQKG